MSEPLERLATRLKASGYSTTSTRTQVFQALQGQQPLTMHDLIARCGIIDRASIYRVIALFEALGIVQRLAMGWKYKLELAGEFIDHHHHFTCVHCGLIIAMPEDSALERRLTELSTAQDFQMTDHQLEIKGFCQACRGRQHSQ